MGVKAPATGNFAHRDISKEGAEEAIEATIRSWIGKPKPSGLDALEAALKANQQDRYAGVPDELKALPQWVAWRHDPDAGKVPCQADGSNARTNDPSTWTTFDAARAAYLANPGKFAGIGFCFAPGGQYAGIDLDGCLANGEVAAWARPWLEKFAGSYIEVSPSGNGLKLWCRGEFGGGGGKRTLDGQAHVGIEIYCKGRFFAVTGDVLEAPAGAIPKLQAAVNEVRAWVKTKPEKPKAQPNPRPGPWTTQARVTVNGRPDAVTRARACIMSNRHPDAVEGRRGHDVIYSAACALVDGFGLDRDAARPILLDFNQAKAIPPESEYQIDHKLDDAIKNHPTPSLRLFNVERDPPTNGATGGQSRDAKEAARDEEAKLLAMYKPRTFGDAARVLGRMKHLWKNWLVLGELSSICAGPKIGKTRTCIGIAKRLYEGASLPDGAENPWGPGLKTMVLPFDRNYIEIHHEMQLAGMPDEAMLYPHDPRDASGISILSLTDPLMLKVIDLSLERDAMIKLVIVDTLTYASEKSLSKPEDMKAMLDGLMEVAARRGVSVLALIHENKEGGSLGRRIDERARILIKLERLSKDDPTKLRMHVADGNFKERPSVLVEHKDDGVEFSPDTSPPGSGGDTKQDCCARHVVDYLWSKGLGVEVFYGDLIDSCGRAGFAGSEDENGRWKNRATMLRAIKQWIEEPEKRPNDLKQFSIRVVERPRFGGGKPLTYYSLAEEKP